MTDKDLDVIESALRIIMRHEDGAPVMEALGAVDRIRSEWQAKQRTTAISASIDIDTSKVQRKLKELQMMSVCMNHLVSEDKEPHIRIEFDSITDVPKVFVDGTDIADLNQGHGLSQLHLDWQTNTDKVRPGYFKVSYIDKSKHCIVTQSESNSGDWRGK